MDSIILHRFRRSTNTTSSSSSSGEDDIFSDANKLAMYVVVPILFIVYGGCACIYCCYRCRQYFKDNQPLEIIKLKIQSFTSNTGKNKAEELFKLDKVPTSAHSSPGVIRAAKYDRDLRSTASTPALHYGTRRTRSHDCEVHNGNTVGIEDLDNANFQEDDSGIQGDSVLTDASPTSYLIERFVSEIPTKQVTVLPYVGRSIDAEGGNSVYYDKADNQKRVFTVDAETQTDLESRQITRSSTNVSSRYLDWLGKSIKKTESREMLLHNKKDTPVSPYGNNQVPRNADAPFQIYGAFLAGRRNSKADVKQTKQTPPVSEYSYVSKSSSRRKGKEILDENMQQFIVAPWK